MHRIALIYLLNDSRRRNRPSAGHREPGYEAASVTYQLTALVGDVASALARGLRRAGRPVTGRSRREARRTTAHSRA